MLIDDLRAHRWSGVPWPIEALEGALCFDITNVRAYLDRVMPERRLADLAQDIPNVAPPAPTWWMEQREPDGAVGMLFECLWDAREAAEAHARGQQDDPLGLKGHFEADISAARWLVVVWCAAALHGEPRIWPWGYVLAVRPDGGLLDYERIGWNSPTHSTADPPSQRWWDGWWFNLYTALMAVCFSHCTGVSTVQHQQARQQRRAAEREGRQPLVTYKTIEIAPVTRVLREQGQIEKTGIKKALHICRGHFAHYTDERPLFGKYTGTFFRPMHRRGTLEAGLALKDYRVLPSPEREG